MNVLLAQSAQQHLARARLFEFLGYFLIGLAVLILLAGLLWSLRKRFDGQRRTLFAVGSGCGLMLLTVALAASLTITFVVTTPAPPPQPRAVAWQPAPPSPPKTIEIEVYISTDGTLTIAEQTIAREAFETFLKQQVAAWQQEEIAVENATIHFHCDPQLPYSDVIELISLSQKIGIGQFTMNTAEE